MVNMVGNKPLRHYLSGSLNKQLTSQQDQHVQLTSPVQFIKHYQPKHTVTNQAMYHVSWSPPKGKLLSWLEQLIATSSHLRCVGGGGGGLADIVHFIFKWAMQAQRHDSGLKSQFCLVQVPCTRVPLDGWLLHLQDGHLEHWLCLLWDSQVRKRFWYAFVLAFCLEPHPTCCCHHQHV